jgi:hypothetical protein
MTEKVLFRWALWNPSPQAVEMLAASVGTFISFFGDSARYVVFTDDVAELRKYKGIKADILDASRSSSAFWDARSTWRKWSPSFRFDLDYTEIYVDSDVFLLRDPVELREFIDGSRFDYVVADEEFADSRPYGNFSTRISKGFVPINAGLLGQRRHYSLQADVMKEYSWWKNHIKTEQSQYHDEQGAIEFALQSHIDAGEVQILDYRKYRIVCPQNITVIDLDDLVAMHATDHGHPAYHHYKSNIWQVVAANTSSAPLGLD